MRMRQGNWLFWLRRLLCFVGFHARDYRARRRISYKESYEPHRLYEGCRYCGTDVHIGNAFDTAHHYFTCTSEDCRKHEVTGDIFRVFDERLEWCRYCGVQMNVRAV